MSFSDTSSSCNSSEPNSPNVYKNFKPEQMLLPQQAYTPQTDFYSSLSSPSSNHNLNTNYSNNSYQTIPKQQQQTYCQQSFVPSFSTTVSHSSKVFFLKFIEKCSSIFFKFFLYSANQENLQAPESPTSPSSPLSDSKSSEHILEKQQTQDDPNSSSVFGDSSLNQENQNFSISYEEISDKIEIGKGRFAVVYRAYWHGLIAIKEYGFNNNKVLNEEEIKSFQEEISNLKKTRHSNLILFIGACIKPDKCAIVMSLCRGTTLYKSIHCESFSKQNFDWILNIAIQIAQGMAYLHNKNMIHKDLRSKNVFIDGYKAIISDFGLYSITNLTRFSSVGAQQQKKQLYLPITKECMYYMAPELVRKLGTKDIESVYSQQSDVYAFGYFYKSIIFNL
jgi:tRNA A-37 threonylcarbamoyl transferase component Bud32